MKAVEGTTSMKILQQQFKTINSRAIKFVCHRRLALHQRTTLAQKLPADCREKLIAYQSPVISLH